MRWAGMGRLVVGDDLGEPAAEAKAALAEQVTTAARLSEKLAAATDRAETDTERARAELTTVHAAAERLRTEAETARTRAAALEAELATERAAAQERTTELRSRLADREARLAELALPSLVDIDGTPGICSTTAPRCSPRTAGCSWRTASTARSTGKRPYGWAPRCWP
ncbi:hypothetical protein HS041_28355 [Planomonospora sp. ID67723]|uniref:hypothetical protein n=1 Tax=Planomonospora sp. ID67723 TaxID=2738134 RepID=UPI0018C37E0C|nr:hypothetical protein [Planomonospora sp. ID67723]MBG0831647.1 hypothetical protein [Planomonospora sp. ID67723]